MFECIDQHIVGLIEVDSSQHAMTFGQTELWPADFPFNSEFLSHLFLHYLFFILANVGLNRHEQMPHRIPRKFEVNKIRF